MTVREYPERDSDEGRKIYTVRLRAFFDEPVKMDLGVGDVHRDGGGHYEPIDGPTLDQLTRSLDDRAVTMPFVSQAQRGWMHANHPDMAKRWEKHTPKGSKLPRHVKSSDRQGGHAAIVVVDNGNGCVLSVSRRPQLDDLGFPGGMVEPGEAPAYAAARELWEETGVEVRVLRKVLEAPASDDSSRTVHVYAASADDTNILGIPQAVPEPNTRVCWVLPSEMLNPSNTFASFAREHYGQLFGHLHPRVTMNDAKHTLADLKDAAAVRRAAAALQQKKSTMSPARYKAERSRIAAASKRVGVKKGQNSFRIHVRADLAPGGQLHVGHHTMSDKTGREWPAYELVFGGVEDVAGYRLLGEEGQQPKKLVWIQLAECGSFRGHPAGDFALTPAVFSEIVRNFEADLGANGRPIPVPIDYEHASEQDPTAGNIPVRGAPAQGWIHRLDNRGQNGLWALVEWLPHSAEQVRSGQYRYISPAIRFGAKDRATGQNIGAKLTSAGLTNQPFLKGMQVLAAKDVEFEKQRGKKDPAGDENATTEVPSSTLKSNIPDENVSADRKTDAAVPPGAARSLPVEGVVEDKRSDGAQFAAMQTLAGDDSDAGDAEMGAFAAYRAARMGAFSSFGAFAAKPAEYMPLIKSAFGLTDLATCKEVMAQFCRLRDRLIQNATAVESDKDSDGVNLNDYIKPLRDIAAKDNVAATVDHILEVVHHMICAAMERHELEMHFDQLAEDDVREAAEEGLMKYLAKDAALAAAFGDTQHPQQPPQGVPPPKKETVMTTISLSEHQAAITAKDAEIAQLKSTLNAAELQLSSEKGKTTELSAKVTTLEAFKTEQEAVAMAAEADALIANPENHLAADKRPQVLQLLKDSPKVARDLYKPVTVVEPGSQLPQKYVHLKQNLPPTGRPAADQHSTDGDKLPDVIVVNGTEIETKILTESVADTTTRLLTEKKLSYEDASQQAWDLHQLVNSNVKRNTVATVR